MENGYESHKTTKNGEIYNEEECFCKLQFQLAT